MDLVGFARQTVGAVFQDFLFRSCSFEHSQHRIVGLTFRGELLDPSRTLSECNLQMFDFLVPSPQKIMAGKPLEYGSTHEIQLTLRFPCWPAGLPPSEHPRQPICIGGGSVTTRRQTIQCAGATACVAFPRPRFVAYTTFVVLWYTCCAVASTGQQCRSDYTC